MLVPVIDYCNHIYSVTKKYPFGILVNKVLMIVYIERRDSEHNSTP